MISNDRIMEEWTNIPDRIRRRWRKLTNEDVRRPDGSSEYLAERLQQRYGVDRREAFLAGIRIRERALRQGRVCWAESATHRGRKENVMDEDRIKGQWKQLRGKLKTRWGKLTDDDLDVADGNADYLAGRLQERYGIAKDEARQQLRDFERGI